MTEHAEEVLIGLAVGRQDQQAFGQLVTRHQSMVRNALRQLTNWDESLADDLAQETFIQAYQNLKQFDGRAKFSSWLYRIAYNQFLQHCRKQSSQKRAAELEELDGREADTQAVTQQAEQEGNELNKQLAGAMAALEPKRRCVLHLLLHRECTQQEIANILQMPLGTVKTHINRGRAELQQQLNSWRPA